MLNRSHHAKGHILGALVVLAATGPLARAEVTLKGPASSVVEGESATFEAKRTDGKSWIWRTCAGSWIPREGFGIPGGSGRGGVCD